MKKRPANIIKGTPSSKGTKEEIQSLIDSLKVKTAPSPSTTIPSLFPPGVK